MMLCPYKERLALVVIASHDHAQTHERYAELYCLLLLSSSGPLDPLLKHNLN